MEDHDLYDGLNGDEKHTRVGIILIIAELVRAYNKFPNDFNSLHEMYGVLLEEENELWEEIKRKNPDLQRIQDELVQVAAMALKGIVQCCLKKKHPNIK